MNLDKFYAALRGTKVNLTMGNVPEFDLFLKWGKQYKVPLFKMAYDLATSYWETAGTMLPVREAYWVENAEAWRKKNLRYYPYYGRGYVQLTWDFNYKKATEYFKKVLKIDVDFVKNPDLVMNKEYAAIILFVGSEQGWFTGKKLDDYIDEIDESDAEDLQEYKNARRVINGTDKALEIANLAILFEKALKAGGYDNNNVVILPSKPVQALPDDPGVIEPETTKPSVQPPVSILEGFIKFLKGLFSK